MITQLTSKYGTFSTIIKDSSGTLYVNDINWRIQGLF